MSRAPRRKLREVVTVTVSRDEDTGQHMAAITLVSSCRHTFFINDFDTLGGVLDAAGRSALEHPDYQRHERFRHGRRE